MALRAVAQKNGTGCFIAAIATLLGSTYEEAYRLCHPGKDPDIEWEHGFWDTSVLRAAFQSLERAGIKGRLAPYKKFSSFSKRNKHALLIIRWRIEPNLCHAIVYDGDTHRFLDPSSGSEVPFWSMKSLEKQLDSAIFVEEIPSRKKNEKRSKVV